MLTEKEWKDAYNTGHKDATVDGLVPWAGIGFILGLGLGVVLCLARS